MKRKKVINSAAETYMNGLFEDGVEIPNEDYENIFDAFVKVLNGQISIPNQHG